MNEDLIGRKFTSHLSVQPIEYEVKRIESDGFVLVQDKDGHTRVMDPRIVRPLLGIFLLVILLLSACGTNSEPETPRVDREEVWLAEQACKGQKDGEACVCWKDGAREHCALVTQQGVILWIPEHHN